MRNHPLLLVLTTAAVVSAAWLAWTGTPFLWPAWAEEPDAGDYSGSIGAADPQLRCKSFEVELGQTLDLPNESSEIGAWVRAQSGFGIWAIDYEAVQKANGYPQHLVQVCLSPL